MHNNHFAKYVINLKLDFKVPFLTLFSGEKESCDEIITSLKTKILEGREEDKTDQSSGIKCIDETLELIGEHNNEIQVSESPPNGTSALEPNQDSEPSCVENNEILNLNSKIQTSENEPSQVLESTRNESKERMSLSMTSNISPITMKPMNQSEIKELIKEPSEKLFDFSTDVFDDNSEQDLTSKVTVSNSKQDESTSRVTGSSCSGTENDLLRDLYEEIDKEKDPDFLPSDVEKNGGKLFTLKFVLLKRIHFIQVTTYRKCICFNETDVILIVCGS